MSHEERNATNETMTTIARHIPISDMVKGASVKHSIRNTIYSPPSLKNKASTVEVPCVPLPHLTHWPS